MSRELLDTWLLDLNSVPEESIKKAREGIFADVKRKKDKPRPGSRFRQILQILTKLNPHKNY